MCLYRSIRSYARWLVNSMCTECDCADKLANTWVNFRWNFRIECAKWSSYKQFWLKITPLYIEIMSEHWASSQRRNTNTNFLYIYEYFSFFAVLAISKINNNIANCLKVYDIQRTQHGRSIFPTATRLQNWLSLFRSQDHIYVNTYLSFIQLVASRIGRII